MCLLLRRVRRADRRADTRRQGAVRRSSQTPFLFVPAGSDKRLPRPTATLSTGLPRARRPAFERPNPGVECRPGFFAVITARSAVRLATTSGENPSIPLGVAADHRQTEDCGIGRKDASVAGAPALGMADTGHALARADGVRGSPPVAATPLPRLPSCCPSPPLANSPAGFLNATVAAPRSGEHAETEPRRHPQRDQSNTSATVVECRRGHRRAHGHGGAAVGSRAGAVPCSRPAALRRRHG